MKMVSAMCSSFEVWSKGWVDDLLVEKEHQEQASTLFNKNGRTPVRLPTFSKGWGSLKMFWLCCWRVGLLLMFGLFYRPVT